MFPGSSCFFAATVKQSSDTTSINKVNLTIVAVVVFVVVDLVFLECLTLFSYNVMSASYDSFTSQDKKRLTSIC